MAVLILAAVGVALGFLVISLARGSTPAASAERRESERSGPDEVDARLADLSLDRIEELTVRLLHKLSLEIGPAEIVDENCFDLVANDPTPLTGGAYLVHGVRSEVPVDSPAVVALGDALRAASATKGILVTNNFFTDEAVAVSRDYPIELVNRRRLRELLEAHHMVRVLFYDQPAPKGDLDEPPLDV